MATEVTNSARSYARTASVLTVALGTAGALAYLFFAVASHNLSEDQYGQIVVLWSLVFLLVSVLFRPVEQLLARTIADLEERGQSIRHASRVAAGIQLLVCGGFIALAVALRPVLQDDLFDGDAMLFWALLATVLAFAASYFARGFFAGSRKMGAYAALLLVEGSVRLGLALLVATGIAKGMNPMVLAIAVAPLASLVVVPFALARSRHRGPGESEKRKLGLTTEAASEFTLAQGGGFAAAVLLIMVSEQILLNSGVLFVRAREDAAAAGYIFNVLMVARAPVVLFQAVAASLLPHLTRLRSRGDETSVEAFALSVRLTLMVIAGFGVAVALGLLVVGPSVMQIAFGDNFEYDRLGLVLVAVGMAFYLSAATLNQAVLAQAQVRRAATCWLASAAVFVLVNLLLGTDAFRAVELGFLVSSLVLCIALYVVYRYPHAEPRDQLSPGSGAELEARLAAADDVI